MGRARCTENAIRTPTHLDFLAALGAVPTRLLLCELVSVAVSGLTQTRSTTLSLSPQSTTTGNNTSSNTPIPSDVQWINRRSANPNTPIPTARSPLSSSRLPTPDSRPRTAPHSRIKLPPRFRDPLVIHPPILIEELGMQQVTPRDHHQPAVLRPGFGEGDDTLRELEGAVARVLVLVSVWFSAVWGGVRSADSDEDSDDEEEEDEGEVQKPI